MVEDQSLGTALLGGVFVLLVSSSVVFGGEGWIDNLFEEHVVGPGGANIIPGNVGESATDVGQRCRVSNVLESKSGGGSVALIIDGRADETIKLTC